MIKFNSEPKFGVNLVYIYFTISKIIKETKVLLFPYNLIHIILNLCEIYLLIYLDNYIFIRNTLYCIYLFSVIIDVFKLIFSVCKNLELDQDEINNFTQKYNLQESSEIISFIINFVLMVIKK